MKAVSGQVDRWQGAATCSMQAGANSASGSDSVTKEGQLEPEAVMVGHSVAGEPSIGFCISQPPIDQLGFSLQLRFAIRPARFGEHLSYLDQHSDASLLLVHELGSSFVARQRHVTIEKVRGVDDLNHSWLQSSDTAVA